MHCPVAVRADFETRVVALLVGRDAIGFPLRGFGCGRIMQFPPGYLATRLLLVGRQRGKAGSSTRCLAALLCAASGAAQAKSITAVTPSFSDVNKAIGSAVDGDTVIIPAGKASWARVLTITKAITLMGQTTIDSSVGAYNDHTIVQYNHTDTRPLISVQSVAGKVYRISGITFQGISSVASANGFIVLGGYSQKVRADHCHFALATSPAQAQVIRVSGAVRGVADHNVIEQLKTQTFGVYNGGSPTDSFGNTAWSQPTGWGSADFFFVEDNYIKNYTNAAADVCDGACGHETGAAS